MLRKVILSLWCVIFIAAGNLSGQANPHFEEAKTKTLLGTLGTPTVQIQTGTDWPAIRGYRFNMTGGTAVSLQAGFSSFNTMTPDYVRYKGWYLTTGLAQPHLLFPDLAQSSNQGSRLHLHVNSFGLNYATGFGPRIGAVSVIPYVCNGWQWSKMDFQWPGLHAAVVRYHDQFEGKPHLGIQTESGVLLRFSDNLAIGAGGYSDLIFPQVRTWPLVGSILLEYSGRFGIDLLSGSLRGDRPLLGSLIPFFLKTLWTGSLYYLRSSHGYWPFVIEQKPSIYRESSIVDTNFSYDAPLRISGIRMNLVIMF